MRRAGKGFSLIEMTLVLLILAVVTSVVVLRLQAPVYRAKLQDVIDRIADYDRLTRQIALERDKRVKLIIDTDEGSLRRTDERGLEEVGSVMALPDGFAITKVAWKGGNPTDWKVEILCSRMGLTRSYALFLEAPDGRGCWLLCSGLTGQFVKLESRDEVDRILEKGVSGHHPR